MEEKNNEIGTDLSSGAEKVNNIEHTNKKTTSAKREKEHKNADRRASEAKKRAEEKDKKTALKLEKKEKRHERILAAKERRAERIAEYKERAAQRRAEKAARKDMLKNETAVQRLERKERERAERLKQREKAAERRHELALKEKEERLRRREAKLKDRQHKREQHTHRKTREHAPGFGGWLAAVIALGVTTLAMTTIVTAGAIELSQMNGGMLRGYMGNVYELDGATDKIQSSLSKLRVASSPVDQSELLREILVNSEIAECDLERIPVDSITNANISAFVNKTGNFCRSALDKIAAGEALSEQDKATVDYLYQTNTAIRSELDTLSVTMTADDMMSLIKGKMDGMLSVGFNGIGGGTMELPESITEGPFAPKKSKAEAKALAYFNEITSSEGESIVKKLLNKYDIRDVECIGEATVSDFTCYNYAATDGRGREYFVQLSERGGKLVMLDSYEECMANNFSVEKCVAIAEKFLSSCGFQGMKAVYSSDADATAEIDFCYEQDGVLCLADKIKVKVCETRGIVTGVEAYPYWLNHEERSLPTTKHTEVEAKESLVGMDVEEVREVYLPIRGNEKLCFEALCNYGGEEYYVYLDADTLQEVALYTVENTNVGKMIR